MPQHQEPRAFNTQVTRSVGCSYLLYLPPGYQSEQRSRWPLLLFLHGAGERGSDLEMVKAHGPPRIVEHQDLPFIVVSPQCPTDSFWSVDVLLALLDEVSATVRVDQDRIYVTGLSMGGYGTWMLASAMPERLAAAAPICGGGSRFLASRMKSLPLWVFHGALDEVVPLSESQEMVESLRACGGNVRFTVYPEAGHDCFTETYSNPELYQWFVQHTRRPTGA